MKQYERLYEKVFTDPARLKMKCNIESITIDGEYVKNIDEYIKFFREILLDSQKAMYDLYIKYQWLSQRFCYNGRRRENNKGNGTNMDLAFGTFIRKYVNLDARLFFGIASNQNMKKVASYFSDFYKDFDIHSPFEHNYEFPYKHITLEYLVVVSDMDERLEMLEYAETNKMRYLEFCDYVLNYINCYNDEHGRKYEWIFSHSTRVTKTENFKKMSNIYKYAKTRKSRKKIGKTSEHVKRISDKKE